MTQPTCKHCFKPLPETWQGFDECPMCVYFREVKVAQQPRHRRASYESPLAALDRESVGHL